MPGQGYWGATRPPEGVLIDPGHPRAQDLINAWAPASAGILYGHLDNQRIPLVVAGNASLAATAQGAGLVCTTAGQGASGTIPAAYQQGWPHTVMARMRLAALPGLQANYVGILLNNVDTAPFVVIEVLANDTGVNFQVDFNDGVNLKFFDTAVAITPYVGQDIWLTVVITATTQTLYINQAAVWTQTTNVTNPQWSATSLFALGNYPGVTRNPNATISWGAWWHRALTQADVQAVIAQPFACYTPPVWRRFFVGAVQVAVPVSDASTGLWTGTPNASLYANLDEAIRSDTDYISSSLTPSSDTCKIVLGDLSTPQDLLSDGITYVYGQGGDALQQIDLTVSLYQGAATLIKQWVHTDISTTLVQVTQTLSSGEAGTITYPVDHTSSTTQLSLWFNANAP